MALKKVFVPWTYTGIFLLIFATSCASSGTSPLTSKTISQPETSFHASTTVPSTTAQANTTEMLPLTTAPADTTQAAPTTSASPPATTTPATVITSAPATSAIAKAVQIGYDVGYPTSTLAMGSIGYAVRFAPDCGSFVVTRISVYGNLYGQDHTGMTFEIRITDENLNVLHSDTFDHTLFTTDPKWTVIDVPSIATKGPFYVMMVTGSKPPPGAGISIGFDGTNANQGSEVTSNWKLADWTKFIPQSPQKSRCNWMIRATGMTSDPAATISYPLVFDPPSWKSMTFDQNAALLDTPQKLSASLVANFTAESHYDPTSTATLYILTPQEVYVQGKGSCNEYSVFSCYVLQQHSVDARILVIKVVSNPGKNHAVCVYTIGAVLYALNNGIVTGPFADYAAIAAAHDSA